MNRLRGALVAVVVTMVALAGVAALRAQAGAAAPSAAPAPTGSTFTLYAAHGSASFVPALQGKRPLFILALGSDARPGQAIERQRSDSIHLIGVNLVTRRATILGFPRDSWVSIPGHGTGKINTALVDGGPALMVKTIEALTGVRIDFWLLTSFPGLISMVNGIGGLTVDVPYPMHDSFSGADFDPGVQHLTGKRALAFARDRHDVPDGDLSRSRDQGILLEAALSKLGDTFRTNPGQLYNWIAIGWRQLHTNLSVATLLQLGLTAAQIRPSNANNLVVPATTGTVGAASVVFISPSAKAIYADMKADGVVGRG